MADCPLGGAPAHDRPCARCGRFDDQRSPRELFWCVRPRLPEGDDTLDEGQGAGTARIPGYQLLGVLGRGGGGTVHRAIGPDGVVALKLMAGGGRDERFQRELELARAAEDPGVLPVLADGRTVDGLPWYAMPEVTGPTLEELLEEPRPPLRVLVALLIQVTRAVERLHAQAVIHRDIKPSNILVTHDGRPLLADLGVALMLDKSRLTQTGQALGTPRFMAPEQLAGTVEDWTLVDVYGLGRTLQEFAGDDLALSRIAARATAVAPARTPGAGELADDLERWHGGRMGELRLRELRRTRWPRVVVGLGVLGAAVFLAPWQAEPVPLAAWTFDGLESPEGFDPLVLHGEAALEAGRVDLDPGGSVTAQAVSPLPTSKTLVVWASSERAGTGTLASIDGLEIPVEDLVSPGVLRQLAISVEKRPSGVIEATRCVDGVEAERLVIDTTLEGTLHLGAVDARVQELRIYEGALPCEELVDLAPAPRSPMPRSEPSDRDGDGVDDIDDACPAVPGTEGCPTHDLAREFSSTSNPNGVWTFGWAEEPGALQPYAESTMSGSISSWGHPSDPWLSVLANPTEEPAEVEVSLTLEPGDLAVHPGRLGELSGVAFQPVAPGEFHVMLRARPIDADAQAKKKDLRVLIDGEERLSREGLVYGDDVKWSQSAAICSSAVLLVGSGGDAYDDDSVGVRLVLERIGSLDGDRDGFAGACDACPGVAGSNSGCPQDRDRDGVPDLDDLCEGPDASGDRDHDGVCDAIDPE